ncbi:MAG: hypothetical protein LBK25_08180 [Treponema sp.]|nr:hypothetical protein [Treponema sp.]
MAKASSGVHGYLDHLAESGAYGSITLHFENGLVKSVQDGIILKEQDLSIFAIGYKEEAKKKTPCNSIKEGGGSIMIVCSKCNQPIRYINSIKGENVYFVDDNPITLITESGRLVTGFKEHICPPGSCGCTKPIAITDV